MFFYFASAIERDIFVKNPDKFTEKVIFSSSKRTPMFCRPWKAAEICSSEKELNNFCPVTLKDEEKIAEGNMTLVVKFDNRTFTFANVEKARTFCNKPHSYYQTELPVKLPPKKEPVGLYNLSKQNVSTTYLE
jgi:YHS domain-containing protein